MPELEKTILIRKTRSARHSKNLSASEQLMYSSDFFFSQCPDGAVFNVRAGGLAFQKSNSQTPDSPRFRGGDNFQDLLTQR